MPRLLWRDAQGIEGSLDLASTEIKVGRAMDCAIRTDDAMVSRVHAKIFWGGGGYVLEDQSSANGVYFQEQRVQSHLFKHGDAVRCGSLWLRFVDMGSSLNIGGGQQGEVPIPVHHGLGPISATKQTGHVSTQPAPTPIQTEQSETDIEIRVLRRRVEQLQAELRVYRSNKFSQENARRMEDLETDLSQLEIERDQLKSQLKRAEQQMVVEAGSLKVQRAIEIATAAAETSASLNDLLSSLRIEVMAAEGEFEQYSNAIPRASFELIRQSLRETAGYCDQARDLLRKLREVAE